MVGKFPVSKTPFAQLDSRRPTLVSLEAPAGPDVTTWDLNQKWELKIEPKLQKIELQRVL